MCKKMKKGEVYSVTATKEENEKMMQKYMIFLFFVIK